MREGRVSSEDSAISGAWFYFAESGGGTLRGGGGAGTSARPAPRGSYFPPAGAADFGGPLSGLGKIDFAGFKKRIVEKLFTIRLSILNFDPFARKLAFEPGELAFGELA